MKPIKSMYKNELANAAGVSRRTFIKWLRTDSEFLQEHNCSVTDKIFPPVVVKYLIEKYVIEL
ncbi:MAG: hypothetical protein EOL95_01365 [Bacteroidia bacterium]|nr:hypothetical protein [Bacteroidia bacterium]